MGPKRIRKINLKDLEDLEAFIQNGSEEAIHIIQAISGGELISMVIMHHLLDFIIEHGAQEAGVCVIDTLMDFLQPEAIDDFFTSSVLEAAVQYHCYIIASRLIEVMSQESINSINPKTGNSLLHKFVQQDLNEIENKEEHELAAIALLKRMSASAIEQVNIAKYTALDNAVQNGYYDIAFKLVDHMSERAVSNIGSDNHSALYHSLQALLQEDLKDVRLVLKVFNKTSGAIILALDKMLLFGILGIRVLGIGGKEIDETNENDGKISLDSEFYSEEKKCLGDTKLE